MVSYDLHRETALLAFTANDVVGCFFPFGLTVVLSFKVHIYSILHRPSKILETFVFLQCLPFMKW